MARPTKLTPELQAAYLDALKRAWYFETAADLAGIDRGTVRRWIKRGPPGAQGAVSRVLHRHKKGVRRTAGDRNRSNRGRGRVAGVGLAAGAQRSPPVEQPPP